MTEQIKQAISEVSQALFGETVEAKLARPDEQFGDYATNIALQLAAKTGKNPREIAQDLQKGLTEKLKDRVAKIEIAGPGFINFTLADSVLAEELAKVDENYGSNELFKGKTIVIEHTDPNPFKEFHIGHAYSNTIGEALGRLFQAAGAKIHQVSYHGDAGLHIAMAIWGMQQALGTGEQSLKDIEPQERHEFLAKAYALGARANKEDEQAAAEIREINKHVYARDDEQINELYDSGRDWSFAYFDSIYQKLGVEFEKQYFETETGAVGQKIVNEHKNVFEESEGAVVYRGEKAGLHTRVFMTRDGLPTYEAKELGLAYAKAKDYPEANKFIVITANEIDDYFRVLVAAIKEIDEQLASKIQHISHGVVKLPSGKMSSRTGGVVTLTHVLQMLSEAVDKVANEKAAARDDNVLGALKYAFLKNRIGGDLIFDIEESVSLEGNSGPYLQYAHARARSILGKADTKPADISLLEAPERSLVRKIGQYPEVVQDAINELVPNHICTYLYELAQNFNRFYENNRVIGDEREDLRLQLVKAYAQVLKNGLSLLNIPAPEKM